MAWMDGVGKLLNKLRTKKQRYAIGTQKGHERAAQFLLQKSLEIVPTETRELAQSGTVVVEGKGLDTIADVVYTAPHAVYVHEDLEKAHGEKFNIKHAKEIAAGKETPRRPQEQAKFLEQPARQYRPVMAEIVKKTVDEYK